MTSPGRGEADAEATEGHGGEQGRRLAHELEQLTDQPLPADLGALAGRAVMDPGQEVPLPAGVGELADREQAMALIDEKMQIAWGSTVDEFKQGNVVEAARRLYFALYRPDEAVAQLAGLNPSFPDQQRFLEARLGAAIMPDAVPDEDEFVEGITKAWVYESDYDRAVYPGAEPTVKQLMGLGPMILWTNGDVGGQPEHGLRGSNQQLHKLRLAGLGNWRRWAQRRFGREGQPEGSMRVMTSESKTDLLPEAVTSLRERGVSDILVLEDRLGNLIAGQKEVEDQGAQPVAIWVRQGKNRDKLPKDLRGEDVSAVARRYHAVDSIGEVPAMLASLGFPKDGEAFGTICDYDDVISDSAKVDELRNFTIRQTLRDNGWAHV